MSVSTAVARIPLTILQGDTVADSTKTFLHVEDVAKIQNSSETQNRKIVGINGQIAVSALISGDQSLEIISGFICWPKERDFPTVDEWDPFSEDDVPGNPTYAGGVAAPFGIRRFAFTLPKAAPQATVTEEYRYKTNSQRLVRPGFSCRHFVYARSSANGVAFSLALQGSCKVLN